MATELAVSGEKAMEGMGAIPHTEGVAFRVWAPQASSVSVIGSFNDWAENSHPLTSEENGYWYGDLPEAKVGDEYRYFIQNGNQSFQRIDPYARQVTNSVGNAVVYDAKFDWEGDSFQPLAWNEMVIYEMHIGTFGRKDGETGNHASNLEDVESKFNYLKSLGVNVIELMPAAEFAGDVSWGYNPAHIFAVESAYGGPDQLKTFVKRAHANGFAVILDVVFNHFGPSDLHLWQFDGWSENGLGGIYFYNDWRSQTPWGDTRPDYGRNEVRQFIFDNAMMWLEDFHIDGLRFDMTFYMWSVDSDGDTDIPEGWTLTQWINKEISARYPGRITIAEDMQNDELLTRATNAGGAGFGAQWDAGFVHPVRETLKTPDDQHRSMATISKVLTGRYNHSAFERVVYTESHDEVANGKARVPAEVSPDDPVNWFAQKRSSLGAALVLTAPGIPMLFQGQEFLQDGWFKDETPLAWSQVEGFAGIFDLYRDLIRLRRNLDGHSKGLSGQGIKVHHLNEKDKMIAFHRWSEGGPADDVIVVLNFANRAWDSYEIGMPRPGTWTLRLNTDWTGYSESFSDHPSQDVIAPPNSRDGFPATANISIGPYSAIVYSQNES